MRVAPLLFICVAGASSARATTEGESASFSLVGFTKAGKHAIVKWTADGGTTNCDGVARMLLLSLATGQLDESVTLFAGQDCGVKPVSRSAGIRRWRERLQREGGLQRGLRLKRSNNGLRGKIGRHRLAIQAKLAASCKTIDQRVELTFTVFNGLVAFPEAWRAKVSCGLHEAMRQYGKPPPPRIWAPAKLTAGRVEPKGAFALVLFAGRPFVVPLAKRRAP